MNTQQTISSQSVNADKMERDRILDALTKWVNQRPGLDPRNYISGWQDKEGRAAYFQESRRIQRQRRDALAMLARIRWSSITADSLKDAFRAYSGRLSWDGKKLDYCTGQYWCVEYRAAACAVLAQSLWDYWRTDYTDEHGVGAGKGAREYIQRNARREFGRGIVSRWFD